MKHRCKIHRVGIHTAWIAVEGDSSHQVIAVPIGLVSGSHDPDGPRPGDERAVVLPGWVREVANLR